ncbi:MAG: cytochrome c [Burkholderiaceae bacterium]
MAILSIAFGSSALKAESSATKRSQVESGASAYAEHCAACHGSDLAGTDHAPGLSGETFWNSWDGKSARQLYGRIISTMPLSDPGSLEAKTVVDITTYILSINKQVLPVTGHAGANDLDAVMMSEPAN